ncbi:MAG: sulfite exporter TauE/SafE family protein [SAR324 cluster bacterium]|nr:sulfite exporter TauE/SafE family protein [SAR324 cluster bacterium]
MLIAGYVSSLIMGIILGLIGGGGSILIIPILVYLFQIPPALATTYSLFIVGFTSLVSSIGYLQQGLINFKTGLIFAVPSILGVFVTRQYVLPNIPEIIISFGSLIFGKNLLIMFVFAVVMILASFSMIKKSTLVLDPKDSSGIATTLVALEGFVIGSVTGFVGAGGGFLIIPVLVKLVKLTMKQAVGTSLMIITVKSLLGFIGDLSHTQSIDWGFILLFSAISMTGSISGVYATRYISGEQLKPVFGWFVLLMGSFVIFKELGILLMP